MKRKNPLSCPPKMIGIQPIWQSVSVEFDCGYHLFHILHNGEIINPDNFILAEGEYELLKQYYKENYK